MTAHARVTDEPLSVDRLAGLVGRPAAGAIVTFQGTTRDVERLDYEAYVEMAEARIGAIVEEASRRRNSKPQSNHELYAAHRTRCRHLAERR